MYSQIVAEALSAAIEDYKAKKGKSASKGH